MRGKVYEGLWKLIRVYSGYSANINPHKHLKKINLTESLAFPYKFPLHLPHDFICNIYTVLVAYGRFPSSVLLDYFKYIIFEDRACCHSRLYFFCPESKSATQITLITRIIVSYAFSHNKNQSTSPPKTNAGRYRNPRRPVPPPARPLPRSRAHP